jgi:hypothetical protein
MLVILNGVKELRFIKVTLFYPLIAAGMASVFCLETKGTKSSRNNDASTPKGKTPGPPFFHPHARIFCFIEYLFLVVKI